MPRSLIVLLLLVVACAHSPTEFPKIMHKWREPRKVTLADVGRLYVRQRISKSHIGIPCRELAQKIQVRIKGDASREKIKTSCEVFSNSLTLQTRRLLPAGNYEVSVVRRARHPFVGLPTVYGDYANPDYDSEADQVARGAVPWDENSSLQGEVDNNYGDRTDWVQLKGEGKIAHIRLSTPNRLLRAGIYRKSDEDPRPTYVGRLRLGKETKIQVGSDDVFIRLWLPRFVGGAHYELSRVEAQASQSISVPVIDSYPLSDEVTLVLFESIEGLSNEARVSLHAKSFAGGTTHLGSCQSLSVQEDQASCRLFDVIPQNVEEVWAKIKL